MSDYGYRPRIVAKSFLYVDKTYADLPSNQEENGDVWKEAIVAVAGIAIGLFIFYGPILDLLRALSG